MSTKNNKIDKLFDPEHNAPFPWWVKLGSWLLAAWILGPAASLFLVVVVVVVLFCGTRR